MKQLDAIYLLARVLADAHYHPTVLRRMPSECSASSIRDALAAIDSVPMEALLPTGRHVWEVRGAR